MVGETVGEKKRRKKEQKTQRERQSKGQRGLRTAGVPVTNSGWVQTPSGAKLKGPPTQMQVQIDGKSYCSRGDQGKRMPMVCVVGAHNE